MEAKKLASAPINLELIEVFATLMMVSRSKSSTAAVKCSEMYLHASLQAKRYPEMIDVGWIFCLTNSSAFWNETHNCVKNTGWFGVIRIQYLQKLGSYDDNWCGSIAYFFVLKLSQFNQNSVQTDIWLIKSYR